MAESAPLPAAIGRYLPQAVLGSGAMGVVYRARDPLLDRAVAVKVMRTGGLEPELRTEYLARFRTEAKAAGRCYHPAIVLVHDFGEDADGPFIVMELVEGPTLAALLRAPGPRDVPGLAALLPAVLDGLANAHALGIVHRDIKPANIIMAGPGSPKIADFGVARLPLAGLTTTGGMLGTPSYMAPEQARGEAVDQRADLFAVAAILYEILLGRPPFAGSGLAETLRRLTGPEPAALGPLGGSPLCPVLRRGLAKAPAERFASAVEFAAALRAALAAPGPAGEGPTLVLPAAAGHDPGFLDRLVADLRPTLGPITPTLVRRAAATAASRDDLLRHLGDALEQPEDRRAFLRRHRVEPQAATMPPTMPPPPATQPGLAWPEPALAAAQTALAFFIGPIARVLVRRAAAEARTVDAFLDQLAAHIPEPREVPAFRRRLKAELEAKLRPGR